MSIGTAIFLSTIAVLAYHCAYNHPGIARKVVLWVLGAALIVFIAFIIWVES
jgi:hypothetical protein